MEFAVMVISSNHPYVKAEPVFTKIFFFKKRMPNNTFLVPSSLQFESRVLNLFQAALTVGK